MNAFETAFGGFARPGSSIDLVSNTTSFGSIDLSHHLKPLSEGILAPELLGGFLHEVEHHTCFVSPVGNALFLLKMRLCRDAIEVLEGNDARLRHFISDYTTYTAAIEVLRPIAEGIALFTEFDAWSLENPQASDTLALAQFFSRKVVMDDKYGDPANTFRWFLQLSRQADHNFETKASLLAVSLRHELGFYLLGYLMIKTVWRAHHERTGRTSDGGQFISYVAAYFYWDLGTVARLLDDSGTSVIGRSRRVLDHIVNRFEQLLQAPTDSLVTAFRSSMVQAANKDKDFLPRLPEISELKGDDLPAFADILMSDEDIRIGRERFASLLGDILREDQPSAEPTVRSVVARLSASIMAQRQYLCLGANKVRVEVSADARVKALDGNVLRAGGKARDGAVPGTDDGWIEVHLIKLPPQMVLTIYRGTKIVLSNIEDRGPYPWKQQFLTKPPEDFTRRALGQLENSIKVLVEALERQGTMLNSGATMLAVVAKEELQEQALLPFSVRSETITDEIESRGWWNFFERDASFLTDYVRVSLLSQTLTLKSEIRDILAADGIDLDAVLARVRRAEQRWNCELIHQSDDVLMCWL